MKCLVYNCNKDQFYARELGAVVTELVGGYPAPHTGTKRLEKRVAAGEDLHSLNGSIDFMRQGGQFATLVEYAADYDGDAVFMASWSGEPLHVI